MINIEKYILNVLLEQITKYNICYLLHLFYLDIVFKSNSSWRDHCGSSNKFDIE